MRSVTTFNDGWLFEGKDKISLPHTAVELPFSYFDESAYWRPFTYEKSFVADPAWAGKEVSLVFDGAMANSKVSLNGEELVAHKDGYTPFEARLTASIESTSALSRMRAAAFAPSESAAAAAHSRNAGVLRYGIFDPILWYVKP